MRHYLFAYGSLISRESRHMTVKTGEATPVQVRGLQRAWNIISPEMKMAGVGVVVNESASCNGVLVKIEGSELSAFDKREFESTNYNYERLQIPTPSIAGLATEIGKAIKVWAYVVKTASTPSIEFPIMQSYVDVILTGCLGFGEKFAIEFIRGTAGWEQPWYNDRNHPRYVRHLKKLKFQKQIDSLLVEYAPSGFNKRRDLS
jgi:hypothetical protein